MKSAQNLNTGVKVMLAVFVLLFIANGVSAAKRVSESVRIFEASVINGIQNDFAIRLAEKTNLNARDFRVKIESLELRPDPQGSFEVVQVLGLGSDGSTRGEGLMTFGLSIKTAQGFQDVLATGVVRVTGPVWTAKNTLNTGRTIEENDLEKIVMPWNKIPTGAAYTRLEDLIGRRVRSYISRGSAVYNNVLEEQNAIEAGDSVELTLKAGPGVMIRSKVIAREKGRIGDRVRLENQESKKTLSGVITGKGQAEVSL